MDNWKYNARTAQAGQANQGFINDGVKIVSQPTGIPATDTGIMTGAIVDQTKAVMQNSKAVGMTPEAIKLEVQKVNQKISFSGFDAQIDTQGRSDAPAQAITSLETLAKTIDNRDNLGFDLTPENALTLHGRIENQITAQTKNLEAEQSAALTGFRLGLSALDVWRQDEGQRDSVDSQKQAFAKVKEADVKLDGLVTSVQGNNQISARAKDVLLNKYNAEKESNSRRMASIAGRIDELHNQAETKIRHQQIIARQAESERKAGIREDRRIQNEKEAEQHKLVMEQRQEALAEGFSIREEISGLNPATQRDKILRLSAQLSNHADKNAHVLTPQQEFAMHNTANKFAKGVAAI